MRRLVIYNLKECFEFGLTFKDLAEIEQIAQKIEPATPQILAFNCSFNFISAKIDKLGKMTLYYEFKSPF
jgi:regulator of sigma D